MIPWNMVFADPLSLELRLKHSHFQGYAFGRCFACFQVSFMLKSSVFSPRISSKFSSRSRTTMCATCSAAPTTSSTNSSATSTRASAFWFSLESREMRVVVQKFPFIYCIKGREWSLAHLTEQNTSWCSVPLSTLSLIWRSVRAIYCSPKSSVQWNRYRSMFNVSWELH